MIKKSLLKPGDILLFRAHPGSGWVSRFIVWGQKFLGRARQGQTYCHVAIVDKDTDFLMEAKWPKTRRWLIDWTLLDKEYDVELWRVRGASSAKVKLALLWAHDHLGEWYDLPLFLFGWFDSKHAEVCSTFVRGAWDAAGKHFETNVDYGNESALITPDEIASNTDLIKRIKVEE
jgi:hypothetical protein